MLRSLGAVASTYAYEQDSERAEEALRLFGKVFDDFLELRKHDPERFDALAVDDDKLRDLRGKTEFWTLDLDFRPEDYFPFLQGIEELANVYGSALRAGNDSSATTVAKFAVSLTAAVAGVPSFGRILSFCARILFKMLRMAMGLNHDSKRILATQWYVTSVFNRSRSNLFDLSNLDAANLAFRRELSYLIEAREQDLLDALISTIHDDFRVRSGFYTTHWEPLIFDVEDHEWRKKLFDQYDKIAKSQSRVVSEADYRKVVEEFSDLADLIIAHSKPDTSSQIQSLLEPERDHTRHVLLLKGLQKLVYSLCSYSLFRKNYEFIHRMWTFQQPLDTVTHWSGRPFLPATINDLLEEFAFVETSRELSWHIRAGHTDESIYLKRFLVLNVLHVLTYPWYEDQPKHFRIPTDWQSDNQTLRGLALIADEYIELSRGLAADPTGFDILYPHLSPELAKTVLDEEVVSLFQKLKSDAETQLESVSKNLQLSEGLKSDFGRNVEKSITELMVVDKILSEFGRLQKSCNREAPELECRIKSYRFDRAMFIEDWHASYHGFEVGISEDVVRSIESEIYVKWLGSSTEVASESEDFLEAVAKEVARLEAERQDTLESLFVLGSVPAIHDAFDELDASFASKWKNIPLKLDREIACYRGDFTFKDSGVQIPIFDTRHPVLKNRLLLIDGRFLGDLSLFRPDLKAENATLYGSLMFDGDCYRFYIKDQTEDSDQCVVTIVYKACFKPDSRFEGYLFKSKGSDLL